MLVPMSSLLSLYVFPPGRAIHALERVAAAAASLGMDEIVAQAGKAMAQFHRALDLQTRLRVGRASLYGPTTFKLDKQVDRGLAAVDDYLAGQTRLFAQGHPRARAAATLRVALFPEGLAAITNQPYVQQHVDVDLMLETYATPELAPARAELTDLDAMMDRVAELNRQYGASIDGYDRGRPSREDLRAAQKLGQDHLAETVVLIAARHILAPPDQRPAVAALLEPILRQNEAIRTTRRRRRKPPDVDPGTGQELPDAAPERPGNEPIDESTPIE